MMPLKTLTGIRTLSAEEFSRDVDGLAPHNDDLLAIEELLGDGAGQATEEVAFAVNDYDRLECRHVAIG